MRAFAVAVSVALASGAFAQTVSDPSLVEKGGAVKRFSPGGVSTVLNLPVATNSERGLLGISLHPDFAANPFVYLYHSAAPVSNP